MNFKEQLKTDLAEVFHNTDEFAEDMTFFYNGKEYTAPVIFDEAASPRTAPNGSAGVPEYDHAVGIYDLDATLYVNEKSIDFSPREGANVEIKNEYYKILKVRNECGEYVIELKRYDE